MVGARSNDAQEGGSMTIKAIETVYNGYRFRSRTEARWAVFFDALGIKYEYEPEGFDLDGIWYLPDFFLNSVDMYAEIKGKEFTAEEREKCRLLAQESGHTVLMFTGTPTVGVTYDGYIGSHCDRDEEQKCLNMFFGDEDIIEAVTAARCARFEHGETPWSR